MQTVNAQQLVAMITAIAEHIAAERERLNALDAALGDGDHGSGLSAAFTKAVADLAASANPSAADVLRVTGLALMNTMGGASGALYGTLFLKASATSKDKPYLTVTDFAELWQAGLEGVMQRGKVQLGGKTLVDALQPAVEVFQQADAVTPLARVFADAAQAAEQGAASTVDMTAQFGRAKFTGERARGHMDAGAASIAVMFGTLRDYWKGVADGET